MMMMMMMMTMMTTKMMTMTRTTTMKAKQRQQHLDRDLLALMLLSAHFGKLSSLLYAVFCLLN